MTTNFMPSQLQRYNMTYSTLSAVNPRLIFAHITGYGDEARRPSAGRLTLPAGGHARE